MDYKVLDEFIVNYEDDLPIQLSVHLSSDYPVADKDLLVAVRSMEDAAQVLEKGMLPGFSYSGVIGAHFQYLMPGGKEQFSAQLPLIQKVSGMSRLKIEVIIWNYKVGDRPFECGVSMHPSVVNNGYRTHYMMRSSAA